MRNRNNNSTHQTVKTNDKSHLSRAHKRAVRTRYDERHNCAEYVAQYNLANMGVDYE